MAIEPLLYGALGSIIVHVLVIGALYKLRYRLWSHFRRLHALSHALANNDDFEDGEGNSLEVPSKIDAMPMEMMLPNDHPLAEYAPLVKEGIRMVAQMHKAGYFDDLEVPDKGKITGDSSGPYGWD